MQELANRWKYDRTCFAQTSPRYAEFSVHALSHPKNSVRGVDQARGHKSETFCPEQLTLNQDQMVAMVAMDVL